MSKLEWINIDDGHMRAAPDAVLIYDIIHTNDGLVSWQGPANEWTFIDSVEAAMAAAEGDWRERQPPSQSNPPLR